MNRVRDQKTFILITAYGSIDSAMAAIRLGTVEYRNHKRRYA